MSVSNVCVFGAWRESHHRQMDLEGWRGSVGWQVCLSSVVGGAMLRRVRIERTASAPGCPLSSVKFEHIGNLRVWKLIPLKPIQIPCGFLEHIWRCCKPLQTLGAHLGKCQCVQIHPHEDSFHQFVNINIGINIPVPSTGLKKEMSLEVFCL